MQGNARVNQGLRARCSCDILGFTVKESMKKHTKGYLRRIRGRKVSNSPSGRAMSSRKARKGIRRDGHYSRVDAQVIVGLMREPYCPNDATLEIRRMSDTIPRIGD